MVELSSLTEFVCFSALRTVFELAVIVTERLVFGVSFIFRFGE